MGGKQLGFGDYEQSTAKKRTKREKFLAEMEAVVSLKALIDLTSPTTPRPAPRADARPICWPPSCRST
jgi:IS5 family transposase